MNVPKALKSSLLGGALILLTAGFVGCSSGPSVEELAQLDSLKKEVSSLQNSANALKEERGNLEKQIAEKNKKLQECEKQKQETKANLEKISK
ncbi:MAG: hypothetical protein WCS69_12330 [Ignavibacteriaceae bacterium]|jgi:septal ring factor EnvC (AmiA/AmiB activator)